jgi:hypothetical protein
MLTFSDNTSIPKIMNKQNSIRINKKIELEENDNVSELNLETDINGDFNYKKKIQIFNLHQKYGNHWKMIASYFDNKSDNFIKNQFFSLIRKSLRNARKILGLYSNTDHINKMLPKVLTSFVNKQIVIDLPNEFHKFGKQIKVYMFDFIKKYSYECICYDKIKDIDLFIIRECLRYLDKINEKYVSSKNQKIKKKKKFNFFKFSYQRFEFKEKNSTINQFSMETYSILSIEKNRLEKMYKDTILNCKKYNEDLKKKLIEILYELGEVYMNLAKFTEVTSNLDYQKNFKNKNITSPQKFITFQNLNIEQDFDDIKNLKSKNLFNMFKKVNDNENQTLQLPFSKQYMKISNNTK